MSDASATILGFAISFSVLLGYGVWLVLERRRMLKRAHLRERAAVQGRVKPGPTESVAKELKPTTRIKAS